MNKKQNAIEFLEEQREIIKETIISKDHADLKSIDICIEMIKAIPDYGGKEPERGTVNQLHKTLSSLISEGVGEQQIKAFDPNSNDWERITSATYQKGEPVQLWTDDID